jgi:hypothetical protein
VRSGLKAEFVKTAMFSVQFTYFIWMYMVKGCKYVCLFVFLGNVFVLIQICVMNARQQNQE